MTTTVKSGLSPHVLAEMAQGVAADQRERISQIRLTGEKRWYERIEHTDDHDTWLIGWLPGHSTGYHDHGGSSGAFAVAVGVLEELHDGQAEVVPAGAERAFGPDYVHDVRNTSQGPAISVHVYSPPLTNMTHYGLAAEGLVVSRTEDESDW